MAALKPYGTAYFGPRMLSPLKCKSRNVPYFWFSSYSTFTLRWKLNQPKGLREKEKGTESTPHRRAFRFNFINII